MRLILMRHAKSDWDSGISRDFDRPLNARGRQDAPRIGHALADREWVPDAVLSSTSCRTRETWERMAGVWPDLADVQFLDTLYHGGPAELAAALGSLTSDVQTVLAIGHNPGWQHAVYAYSGESITLTTANAALLELESMSWIEASRPNGQWHLIDVLRPKDLPGRL